MSDHREYQGSAGDLQRILLETVGHPGRLISASKSGYMLAHPDHLVAFNANVCIGDEKAWWGDFDLTLSEDQLKSLAAGTGRRVALVKEHDGRFENEGRPLVELALYSVSPSGHHRLGSYWHTRYWRDEDGRLRRLLPPTPPRFRRPRRPTVWRVWLVEHEGSRKLRRGQLDLLWELRVGGKAEASKQGARSLRHPLLVLGFSLGTRQFDEARVGGCRATWYPSSGYRWLPGLRVDPDWRLGRNEFRLSLVLEAGVIWECSFRFTRRRSGANGGA